MPEVEYYTGIWVHAANVPEVNNEQGFVECTQKIADLLIERGDAQDPTCGAFDLIEMEDPTASAPKKPRKKAEPVAEANKSMTAGTETATYHTKNVLA